jgi:uncharacterized protein (DUF1810 family)
VWSARVLALEWTRYLACQKDVERVAGSFVRKSGNEVDTMSDLFDLHRFVTAQQPVLAQLLRELTEGRKCSHWMWFVFPQLAGLGHSATARFYAIASINEARAYLQHPVLGQRLIECTALVNKIKGRSVHEIFGNPDDLKFHSSMTLFAYIAPEVPAFRNALAKYFGDATDHLTIEKLRSLTPNR